MQAVNIFVFEQMLQENAATKEEELNEQLHQLETERDCLQVKKLLIGHRHVFSAIL